MIKHLILPDSTPLDFSFPDQTRDWLATRCFRPTNAPLAGNFLLWRTIDEMLGDAPFMTRLLAEVNRTTSQTRDDRHSLYFSVKHDRPVGWDTTILLADTTGLPMERFNLGRNGGCSALRIKPEARRLAPLTNETTFSCEFLRVDGEWTMIVHTIYPGYNMGSLNSRSRGREETDLTACTGRVYFRLENPGEPPPAT